MNQRGDSRLQFLMGDTRRRSAWVLTALILSGGGLGCTDSRLQYQPAKDVEVFDKYLKVEGQLCTYPADNVTFPVKILFLLDSSASLQCTDLSNVRYAAMQSIVQDVLAAPNVEVGAVAFSSFSRRLNFTTDATAVTDFLGDPTNQNGTATDYQGAVATAVQMVEQDMVKSGGAARARTRYVVIMVSDGLPLPLCNAGCEDDISNCSNGQDDDGDGLVDGADPDCANINDNVAHPDNLAGVCNTDPTFRRDRVDPTEYYVDMQGVCPAYNQKEQIMARVEDLMALKDAYSAGDLTVHSVFLFAPEPVVRQRCTAAYAQLLGGDRTTAVALMQAVADAGHGTFRDVNTTTVEENFLEFDYTSLESTYWLTEMLAVNQHALPTVDGMVPDSDMDGLSDDDEALIGTDWLDPDSDNDVGLGRPNGDLYSDFFETHFLTSGFDPKDASLPAATCNSAADADGDGLNDCEEGFLGTDPLLADTDGDRVPDQLEFRAGLDPLRDDSQEDPDFDGLSNRDEIRARTLPMTPDLDRYRSASIRYGVDDLGDQNIRNAAGQLELRRCYDFRVSRIELVPTPLPSQRGLNRILIYAMQEPVQLVGASPITEVACVEANYQGETTKDPPSGVIDVTQDYWDTMRFAFDQQFIALIDDCKTNTSRGSIITRMRQCLPPKVQVGQYLYTEPELEDLVRKYVDPNLNMRVPQQASDLFVELTDFDADRDCHRPWEIGRLQEMLNSLRTTCGSCEAAQ